jgi:peptide/nickel transport system permease protein
MTTYIIRRLIQAIIVIIIVTIVVFLAVRLLPGDPVLLYLSQEELEMLTPERIEQVRQEFGLDKPIYLQYFNWVNDIFHGDLGTSMFYREPVGTLIAQRVPVTLHLGVIAMVLGAIFGISGGLVAALRWGKTPDTVVTSLANIGICIPIFWLGILMIWVFGLQLGWLPLYGYTSPFKDFGESSMQLIMPVICLCIMGLAGGARQMRSSTLEVIWQDYIRTAWAKGLRERVIVTRHILKNALIPVITLMGMMFSHILGGTVLIEQVFNIPGMGRLSVDAVFSQDYAVIQAVILLTAVMVVLVNLLVDISYGWLDPRIRYG